MILKLPKRYYILADFFLYVGVIKEFRGIRQNQTRPPLGKTAKLESHKDICIVKAEILHGSPRLHTHGKLSLSRSFGVQNERIDKV